MCRLLAGAATVGLVGTAGAFGAGVAAADETALIVGGTGPSPYPAFQELAHEYDYVSMPIHIGEKYYDSANANRRIVDYPASLWPFSGLDTPTVGVSIATGADNLDTAIRSTSGPIVVAGLSQGTMVLDAEKARLARDPNAPSPSRLRFIEAGNPNAIAQKVFPPGTFLPFLNYTVPAPVDSQYDTTVIKAEYDAWADPPDRMDNYLAVANSIFGGQFYHTESAFSDPADIAPQNVTVTTNSRGARTTTYFLPATQLPLTKPLRDLGVSDDMVNQIDAALRPTIDSAYYRHNPPQSSAPAPAPAAPTVTFSETDQANIDNAVRQVQQVKLNPTEQANLDNAVQQVKNLLPPGIG